MSSLFFLRSLFTGIPVSHKVATIASFWCRSSCSCRRSYFWSGTDRVISVFFFSLSLGVEHLFMWFFVSRFWNSHFIVQAISVQLLLPHIRAIAFGRCALWIVWGILDSLPLLIGSTALRHTANNRLSYIIQPGTCLRKLLRPSHCAKCLFVPQSCGCSSGVHVCVHFRFHLLLVCAGKAHTYSKICYLIILS